VKWRALDILVNANTSLPQTLIAIKMDCCKSNITQITDKLEAEGLIVRTIHPSDRRTTLIEITEQGRDMQKQGRATILAAASEFTAPLTGAKREQLDALLAALVGAGEGCGSTPCQSDER
jgi:DNA-binding MarR family transcriptional regulator